MWEEAIKVLNSMPGPKLPSSEEEFLRLRDEAVPVSIRNIGRLGVEIEELNKLNVIHVSGTKGKGSTCAYIESILRHKGFKTGFLSSPHVVDVRERIRINGKPISKQMFAQYCLSCYETFSKYPKEELPTYIKFLTVVSFLIFLREEVDVAVVEVGIGGEYDFTNVFTKPTVCGVTRLDLDHMDVLGDTIESIAWHKAGIFKTGAPAVTMPQCKEAMSVLVERAKEKGIPLYLSNPLPIPHSSLGIPEMSDSEISSSSFSHLPLECSSISLSSDLLQGLSSCTWPGRCQTVKFHGVSYYIDGAHTEESMQKFNFHYVLFTPSITNSVRKPTNDMEIKKQSKAGMLQRCLDNKQTWQDLLKQDANDAVAEMRIKPRADSDYINIEFVPSIELPPHPISYPFSTPGTTSYVMPSIQDSLVWVTNNKDDRFCYTPEEAILAGFKFAFDDKPVTENIVSESQSEDDLLVQVFCTGSLFLVGGVLRFVDPPSED